MKPRNPRTRGRREQPRDVEGFADLAELAAAVCSGSPYTLPQRSRWMVDADLQRRDPPWTKAMAPYAFDPYTIWGHPGANPTCNATDWTDRLSEWDPAKYERIVDEAYPRNSQPFSDYGCRGDLIQKFLRLYHEDPSIILLRVIAYCNASNGYPLWRLDYKSRKHKRQKAQPPASSKVP